MVKLAGRDFLSTEADNGGYASIIEDFEGTERPWWEALFVNGKEEVVRRAVTAAVFAFRQTYSATTTASDPGPGTFRFNGAPGAATAAYLDLLDADGADVSGFFSFIAAVDNPTKATMRVSVVGGASNAWHAYSVTAVASLAGYAALTIAHVAQGGGAFTAGDELMVGFQVLSNQGPAGAVGSLAGGNLTGALNDKADTIASAGTVSIGAAGGNSITITGSTGPITSFGTEPQAGAKRYLTFASTPTINHSPTLKLPGARNLTVAAGDILIVESLGSGNGWKAIGYLPTAERGMLQGVHTIWLDGPGITPRTTNGPTSYSAETATNKVQLRGYSFDPATAQYLQARIAMPKGWDRGTFLVEFIWVPASGSSGNVVWAARALALSDGDPLDTAFGSAVTVTDGYLSNAQLQISPQSAAITPSNSPAQGDVVILELYRDAANGADTMGVNAVLLGVRLLYGVSVGNDA